MKLSKHLQRFLHSMTAFSVGLLLALIVSPWAQVQSKAQAQAQSQPTQVGTPGQGHEAPAELLWPALEVSPAPVDSEKVSNREGGNEFGLNRSISKVSIPEVMIYEPPAEKRTGIGMVICPGGGFRRIVIDREGHDIARWLASQGIVAMVLKYRTVDREDSASLQDIQRAVRLLRSRSKPLGVDPARIGVMGFSAGGYLVLRSAVHHQPGDPAAKDSLNAYSSRPDFVAAVYPAVPPTFEKHFDSASPPVFAIHAFDDRLPAEENAKILLAGKRSKVPIELHIFAKGGHGFGLGDRRGAVGQWKGLFVEWLKTMRFIEAVTEKATVDAK